MQALFTYQSNEFYTLANAQNQFDQSVADFFSLYNYILYSAISVAKYVATDAEVKASQFLLRDDEREVNAKLLSNQAVTFFDEHAAFQKWTKDFKASDYKSESLIQSIYHELVEQQYYLKYLSNPLSGMEEDIQILEEIIFDLLLPNEVFVEHLADIFVHIQDDGIEVERMLERQFDKAKKRKKPEILLSIKQEKVDELVQFGHQLIQKTADHSKDLEQEYASYLHNWDVNRLASIDTLLLKMALCELLYFKEIPVKVTINEYIDISKEYSTPKSKEFINGILDKMMKEFTHSGKIVKSGRGLK